ncbi:MAG: PP2C family protein-serine/threonine phosphatase, partial [Candidatus Sericytochromatia bacterium]
MPAVSGLSVSGACQAAREVGGDFYDVVPLPDGRVALALGDVSGKSVSAALYMAVARTALRMTLAHGRTPRECLISVNERIAEDIKDGSFITCFLGLFDPATGEFTYASAGHHLGWLMKPAGPTALTARGLPLGLDPAPF